MRTKPADKYYCGVDPEKVSNAEPKIYKYKRDWFMYMISERYQIHINKDIRELPRPYTDDPILDRYRFTNVKREHDTESEFVIHAIANNRYLSLRDKMLNIIVFRLFNKHQTFLAAGYPKIFSADPTIKNICDDPEKALIKWAKEYPDYTFFTGVFYTSGIKVALNKLYKEGTINGKVFRFVYDKYHRDHLIAKILKAKNQKQAFNLIKKPDGIGNFMAYQIFVDFTYIKEYPFSENEFTIAGPGCKWGIDELFKDKDGMTYEECIFWIRDNWDRLMLITDPDFRFNCDKLMVDVPTYDRNMNVMSIENCFCEFSKYCRVKTGKGRAKNVYKPREDGKYEL